MKCMVASDTETQKDRDTETQRHIDTEIQRHKRQQTGLSENLAEIKWWWTMYSDCRIFSWVID